MATVSVAGVAFAVPGGYVDRTNYTFRDDGGARLSVSADVEGGGEPLGELARQARQDAVEGLGGRAIDPPVSGTVAGLPAVVQAFEFVDGGRPYRERVAVARSDRRQLILSFAGPQALVDAAAEVIFRSAAWGSTPAEAPPSGFVARSAGVLALNLPSSLQPPRQVAIASADGAVRATIGEIGGDGGSAPPADLLARDRELGKEIVDLRTRVLTSQRATVLAYLTVEDDDSETGRRQAVRRALIHVAGDRAVAVHIVASTGRAEEADSLLTTLLARLGASR